MAPEINDPLSAAEERAAKQETDKLLTELIMVSQSNNIHEMATNSFIVGNQEGGNSQGGGSLYVPPIRAVVRDRWQVGSALQPAKPRQPH